MLNVRGVASPAAQDSTLVTATKSRPAVALPLVAEAETVIAPTLPPGPGDGHLRVWYRLHWRSNSLR